MKAVVTRVIMALVLVLVSVAPASVVGQAPAPGRVAFVNARAVLQGMPGYAQAESTFAKEVDAGQVEVARLQTALDSAVADFQQQQVMLSPSNRSAKQKELEGRNQALQQRSNAIRQRLAAREEELLSPMQERLTAIIEGIRAEGNYSMVIDVSAQGLGIVTFDKALDITQRVIQRLAQAPN
ncbi:MAG: OmpH family outer membrane protein [Gemmatimonadota bacterium]